AATQIVAGGGFTCVLASGKVYCSGISHSGETGQTATSWLAANVQVSFPNATTNCPSRTSSDVSAITAGQRHACALRTRGPVWCWGDNFNGQLGNGATLPGPLQNATPVQVMADSTTPLTSVNQISAGQFHTCATAFEELVYCWGKNNKSQLGPNSTAGTDSSY